MTRMHNSYQKMNLYHYFTHIRNTAKIHPYNPVNKLICYDNDSSQCVLQFLI